ASSPVREAIASDVEARELSALTVDHDLAAVHVDVAAAGGADAHIGGLPDEPIDPAQGHGRARSDRQLANGGVVVADVHGERFGGPAVLQIQRAEAVLADHYNRAVA